MYNHPKSVIHRQRVHKLKNKTACGPFSKQRVAADLARALDYPVFLALDTPGVESV